MYRHDDTRVQRHFAREQKALQLTTAQQPRRGVRSSAADAEALQQRLGEAQRALPDQERAPRKWGSIIRLEDRVVDEWQIADQPLTEAVLRDVRDAKAGHCPRSNARHVGSIHAQIPGSWRPQSGHYLGELALAVVRHTGDAQDLAHANVKVDLLQ